MVLLVCDAEAAQLLLHVHLSSLFLRFAPAGCPFSEFGLFKREVGGILLPAIKATAPQELGCLGASGLGARCFAVLVYGAGEE